MKQIIDFSSHKMHFRFLSCLPSLLVLLILETTQFFTFQEAHGYVDHDCYPPCSQVDDQYIIGYARLMQKATKDATHPKTGDSVPIRVEGYERSWTHKAESVSFSTTYLGAHKSTNTTSSLNAVYFKISKASALHDNDEHEFIYCREEVNKSSVQLLTKDSAKKGLPKGQFWIYVTKPEHWETATEKYPIVQSYVDTFLSGCLELETKHKLDGFAEECVHTTSGWESPWVNDRIFPRRPFIYQKMSGEIDGLLNRTVHEAFKKIKIQG